MVVITRKSEAEGYSMLAENLGDRIVLLRRRYDITQEQLAEMVGLDRTRLSRVERNQGLPGLEPLIKMAQVLKTNVHFLATGEELTPDEPEGFMTPEANDVGALMDGMDPDSRQIVLSLARDIARMDQQRRTLQEEFGALLVENISDLEAKAQSKARLILSKINRPITN